MARLRAALAARLGATAGLALLGVACRPATDPAADADGGAGAATAATAGHLPFGIRRRTLFVDGWRFARNDPPGTTGLSYEETKAWTLPTGNAFIIDASMRHARPAGNPGEGVAYAAPEFDDSAWRAVTLPHDYAIEGPFTDEVPANMGRLPATGVAWYRKTFTLAPEDDGRSIFVDFDGAMSYSLVWVNGQIAGGWPYGYSSWRVDVTPYVRFDGENVIAVRLDNPVPSGTVWNQGSSRWYPGAGIYRDVWLVTTEPVHVAQWGTWALTPEVNRDFAFVTLDVTVDNDSEAAVTASIDSAIYEVDANGERGGTAVTSLSTQTLEIASRSSATAISTGRIGNPRLWGPPPKQVPNLYEAVTTVSVDGEIVDDYMTRFGVRTLEFNPDAGLLVNGERVQIKGVNQHHDLGALGAVANARGKERQLEILAGMGVNAVRTAHNPEAPVFYDIADRMGILVLDEAFDVWSTGKTDFDHHLFFDDWHEQDLRALIRRDRNHPSVILWSIGNEIPGQTDPGIFEQAARIRDVAVTEDYSRLTLSGMNAANPGTPFADAMEAIGLNYQGSGVRDAPPEYPDFHRAYPDHFLVGTETAATFSSRGVYTFPVTGPDGMPATADGGGMTPDGQVSSYDLYHASWSYVPELEFRHLDQWRYVAGEFVWTGFDYLGEPDPHSRTGARSSYYGIVDLAGFPKDRYYLYQSHWRPELPMVHILPHWNWPGREGEITPIHIYTSGDSAELYINDRFIGRRAKGAGEYRLRFDDVAYEPGVVRVVAYREGEVWAVATTETTGTAAAIVLQADRSTIAGDGRDLAFVTARVVDSAGRLVPDANHRIRFSVEGPGEIVATDNGNAMDRDVFTSPERNAFGGLALAIVRASPGELTVRAAADGLAPAAVALDARREPSR